MAKNNVVLISNELEGLFHRMDFSISNSFSGVFTSGELKEKVQPIFKNKFLDLMLIDFSAFETEDDGLEFIEHIKTVTGDLSKESLRIVVIAPNLSNEDVLHSLVVYQCYDILTPVTTGLNKAEAEQLFEREITLNLINPKTFSQVKHLIKKVKSSPVEQPSNNKPIFNFKQKMAKDKLRAFVIYEDDNKGGGFEKKLEVFSRKSRLFYVDSKPFSLDVKDSLSNIASLYIDILIIYQPNLEQMKDIIEIIQTVDNRINIHVIHREYAQYDELSKYIISKNVSTNVRPHFVQDFSFQLWESEILDSHIAQNQTIKNTILLNKASVISVVGAKGGVGTTTIASLLAKDFAKVGNLRTVVVDFSYYVGDLKSFLNIPEPKKNIFNWFSFIVSHLRNRTENLESYYDLIVDYCDKNSDGLYVLNTPNKDFFAYTDFDINEDERIQALNYTMKALKSTFDVVILDVNTIYSNFDVALLESSHAVLVTEPNISALYKLKTLLNDTLEPMYHFKKENIYVVVNKDMSKNNDLQKENLEFLAGMLTDAGVEKTNVIKMRFDLSVLDSSNQLSVFTKNSFNKKALTKLADSILPLFKGNPYIKNKKANLLHVLALLVLSASSLGGLAWYLFVYLGILG